MRQRKTYTPENVANVYGFDVQDIIKLCEDKRMNAVFKDGEWYIDESVFSTASSDFKNYRYGIKIKS